MKATQIQPGQDYLISRSPTWRTNGWSHWPNTRRLHVVAVGRFAAGDYKNRIARYDGGSEPVAMTAVPNTFAPLGVIGYVVDRETGQPLRVQDETGLPIAYGPFPLVQVRGEWDESSAIVQANVDAEAARAQAQKDRSAAARARFNHAADNIAYVAGELWADHPRLDVYGDRVTMTLAEFDRLATLLTRRMGG
jgi:hypothetical protein